MEAATATSKLSQSNRRRILLSLDGGGIRGVSILRILQEIFHRLKYDLRLGENRTILVSDYFDLIGGTGTGGLIGLMLGPLGMSIDAALDKYVQIFQSIHEARNSSVEDPTFLFEARVQEIVEECFPTATEPVKMWSDKTKSHCKTFVCAMSSVSMSHPHLFRTYGVRALASHNCTIWEAARATTATPSLFSSITVGFEGQQEAFIDAGFRCNNPSQQVISEARENLGADVSRMFLISIGAGHPGNISLLSADSENLAETTLKIALDCEAVAHSMEGQLLPDAYFRLSVEQGLQSFNIKVWEDIGVILSTTKAYLDKPEVNTKIEKIVALLKESRSTEDGNLTRVLPSEPGTSPPPTQFRQMMTWATPQLNRNTSYRPPPYIPPPYTPPPYPTHSIIHRRTTDLPRLPVFSIDSPATRQPMTNEIVLAMRMKIPKTALILSKSLYGKSQQDVGTLLRSLPLGFASKARRRNRNQVRNAAEGDGGNPTFVISRPLSR